MDLFDYMKDKNMEKESPLASRMRPVTLDEVVGQEHIIGRDKLLYRAIQADKLSSIIFYGPPGTGKTTLAQVIANTTSAEFTRLNATTAGKKDMEEVVKEAEDRRGMYGKKTILFVDEIHRFNKGQQDYLLPFVEDGTVVLIGATTAIELGILTTSPSSDGKIHIDLSTASECIQKRVVRYDKTGDQHYDTISAFIKSMRGTDPDAAVYYLAKMLYAGEDIKFIARRIMICASEDVGNADPQALVVAVAAAQAVERLGMPEARIVLSQAVTYVASAPKSNAACLAIDAASESVAARKTTVPPHLQDAHYKGAAKLGHGRGYQYAHDFPNHYVEQQYLPSEIAGETFYHPTENGYEAEIRKHFRKIGREK